jgi:hypothetical protein
MDALIFNELAAIQTEADKGKKAELKARSNARLGEHFARHQGDLEELAFDLLNAAWADAMGEDVVPRLIEVKTVGLADTDYVETDKRGGRAYWQGKGGQIRSDILRYSRTQMPREELVTALDFHQDEIATDFWGTFSDLVGQAQEKLRQLPTERLVELLQAAITGGTYYGTFAASSLTDDQVDGVLEEVAIKSNGQVSIVGTRVAIRNLAGVGIDFGDNVAEEVFKTGQIGIYKGYPVVQVENFENFDGDFVLPNDELWLVGRNAGRLTYFGSAAKVQQLRRASFMLRWETARDAGMLLYGADYGRVGRIVLT